eukprot:2202797-Pyramimonas_sp.AAC.1
MRRLAHLVRVSSLHCTPSFWKEVVPYPPQARHQKTPLKLHTVWFLCKLAGYPMHGLDNQDSIAPGSGFAKHAVHCIRLRVSRFTEWAESTILC